MGSSEIREMRQRNTKALYGARRDVILIGSAVSVLLFAAAINTNPYPGWLFAVGGTILALSAIVSAIRITNSITRALVNVESVGKASSPKYVEPLKWHNTEALKASSSESVVARLSAGGDRAFVKLNGTTGGNWPDILAQMNEEPFDARKKWTMALYRNPEIPATGDVIYAFRDDRDAVEFALRYF